MTHFLDAQQGLTQLQGQLKKLRPNETRAAVAASALQASATLALVDATAAVAEQMKIGNLIAYEQLRLATGEDDPTPASVTRIIEEGLDIDV